MRKNVKLPKIDKKGSKHIAYCIKHDRKPKVGN